MRPTATVLTLARTLLVVAALPLTLGAQSSSGADRNATAIAAPTAARPFTVRVIGRGRPVLLIPGLMSGGDVWDATVAHCSGKYELHVVTLAGFAGVPAVPGPTFMTRARDALRAYVHERTLDRPIVVGHSLGGTLAFAMAAAAPDTLGGVMAVDGVPFIAALTDSTATEEGMRARVEPMRAMYATLSPTQLGMQTRLSLPTLMRDTTQRSRRVRWAEGFDPATVGQAMAEMMTTDLRGRLRAVRMPVLLMMAAGAFSTPDFRNVMQQWYAAQLVAVPQAELVVAERGYHFIMLDDPTFFHATLERFLASAIACTTSTRATSGPCRRQWACWSSATRRRSGLYRWCSRRPVAMRAPLGVS
jgi:pimeloyl-ACP methyl ester carboxylesterase